MAVGVNAAAQTRAQCDQNKVLHIFRTSINLFTYCCCLCIVGERYRNMRVGFDHLSKRDDPFPSKVDRIINGALVVIPIGSSDTYGIELVSFAKVCYNIKALANKTSYIGKI